jgi:hypothetical protein
MLAQSLYSQKELMGKKFLEQAKMCCDKGHNWSDLDDIKMYGTTIVQGGTAAGMSFVDEHALELIERIVN